MMNNFADLFGTIENDFINEQRKLSINSVLQVYYGITSNKLFRISFISSSNPFELISTAEIKVTQGKESDHVYWTCFDLLCNDVKDVFFVFCDSLVEAIVEKNSDYEALLSLKNRYYSWKMLLKNKGKISYEKYQGLYGELYFLKEYLSKEEGLDNAILSWVGPDGYSKDFSINDIWYEIKTIGTSSKSVKINSLTQLESSVKGYLVVIVVEKMSNQFILKESTIHFLYRSILESISNNEIKEKFINKVLDYGYIDENLCEECARFDVKSVDFYVVDKRFPKLTRESIKSPAIYEVTYELDLNAIREYKETD